MKIKICGMTQRDNILEVAQLHPNYLGFIFYTDSKRFFSGHIPALPKSINKTGVFVNAPLTYILQQIKIHQLDTVQLHGSETDHFCKTLKKNAFHIELIKVFGVKNKFDFSFLKPYEEICDYFLFDTKGDLPGGNGIHFNWEILEKYSSKTPYFLSGGIGLDTLKKIQVFTKSKGAKYCYAIDVNSRFEDKVGIKNTKDLKIFKQQVLAW